MNHIPPVQTPLEEQSFGQTSFPIVATTDSSSKSFLMLKTSYFFIFSKQSWFKDSTVYLEKSVVPLSCVKTIIELECHLFQ